MRIAIEKLEMVGIACLSEDFFLSVFRCQELDSIQKCFTIFYVL